MAARVSTVGILGGMGPEATNLLCQLITELTPARCDQDHIPVISFNNPAIPDRTSAIMGGGASPLPELTRTARTLERAGAHFLVMPCNTAHYFIDQIEAAVEIPVLNMIEETVGFIVRRLPAVRALGLLATEATIEAGLYSDPLTRCGMAVVVPGACDQQAVMDAIYAEGGIKSGCKDQPARVLDEVGERLALSGADAILLGCTEISLVLRRHKPAFAVIDPLEIIAKAAVAKAIAGFGSDRPPAPVSPPSACAAEPALVVR